MRKIVFMKGPPGSGKSTLIRELGWEAYALGQDSLRLLRRAPELTASGHLQISQEENDAVFREFLMLLDKRMERGEFVVLDGVFSDPEMPPEIAQLIHKHRYTSAVVDLSTKDLETVKEQNRARPEYRHVPAAVVEKIHKKSKYQPRWVNVPYFVWEETGQFLKDLQQWSRHPLHNFNQYTEIVHIGDLQGCFSVLKDPQSPLAQGFDPNKAYIFVGDLLDRGIENGEVLRWVVDEALSLPNTFFMWGNHEDHLHRWARGLPAVSEEFEHKTLPQLLAKGCTPADAEKVCQKAMEALFYEYRGQRVMVTHAGLPTVPARPELISLRQYAKGTGRWSDPIDEQFERNAPSDWIQVHGHRNHGWQDIRARPRSFNLEDQVEFGGRLRMAILNPQGWSTLAIRNQVYELDGASKIERRKMQWKNKGVTLSDGAATSLREHSGVKERVQDDQNHIASFNFAKDVFFKASWDDVSVKARGFFVNRHTNEIVSRGYEKFFNINERPETHVDALASSLSYPVLGYVKENGYLGNVGYDSETGELFVATKSTSGGHFSEWFRAILDTYLTKAQQEGLARFLRDNEACMTFEVIDPINDPHMIEYATPQLILLDVFHRHEEMERLEYEELRGVAKKFGLPVKQRGLILHDEQSFKGWHAKVSQDLSYRFQGKDIEGFVLEDQKGFMTKIKMPHYAFWKRMRGLKDRMKREWVKILKAGEDRNAFLARTPKNLAPEFNEQSARAAFEKKWMDMDHIHPAQKEFVSWCVKQPMEMWDASIIDLRQKFLQTPYDQSVWSVPFEQYQQPPSNPQAKPLKP